MTDMQDVIATLERHLKTANANIAAFKQQFDQNPFVALSWATNVARDVADASVYTGVLKLLKTSSDLPKMPEHLHAIATDHVRRLMRTGFVRSTSALDAALHSEELRAWALVLALLEGRV